MAQFPVKFQTTIDVEANNLEEAEFLVQQAIEDGRLIISIEPDVEREVAKIKKRFPRLEG